MTKDLFSLTHADKHSATWVRLKEHLEKRLQHLRIQNDSEHDAVKTAAMRGRIQQLKELIALDKDLPVIEDQEF